MRKWFSVRALSSRWLTDTCIRGRLLIICSTSVIIVTKVSSFGVLSFKATLNAFLTFRTSLFQLPSICGAWGGMKCQVTLYWRAFELMYRSSISSQALRTSLSAPRRFVPLSEYISAGQPLRAANLLNSMVVESVINDDAIIICIVRIVKHVNGTPHLFFMPSTVGDGYWSKIVYPSECERTAMMRRSDRWKLSHQWVLWHCFTVATLLTAGNNSTNRWPQAYYPVFLTYFVYYHLGSAMTHYLMVV